VSESDPETLDDSREVNPNGAVANIAGLSNPEGTVLAMMPHPERASEELLGSADGRLLFAALVDFLKQ